MPALARLRQGVLPALAAVLVAALLVVAPQGARAAAPEPVATPAVDVELFVREGCPRCAEAERFLARLQAERPALQAVIRDVGKDALARERLRNLVAATASASGVPAVYAGGELVIGFAGDDSTGERIRALVDRRPAPSAPDDAAGASCTIEAQTSCTAPPEAADSIVVPWLGTRISVADVGLPLFTIAIGLIDGFNPCSMWVLLLMISMLAAVGDRRRMLAIAGTFVVVEGVAYFAFMAAWLNLFLIIGLSRTSEIALGAIAVVAGLLNVKDFFAFGRGISLSIPASAKPGIYARMRSVLHERSLPIAIAGTVVLAVFVQIVELLCTSGLPALYTRILTLANLDPWRYYGYLLLYVAMYMVDDVIVLAIGVVTLDRGRLQESGGRRLKLLSGVVMLALGLYLILPR